MNSSAASSMSGRRSWRRFGEGRALGSAFLLNGLLISSWASEIPVVQQHLGLSTAQLGLVLLALPAGTVLVLPVVTWVLRRRSPRFIISVGLVVQMVAFTHAAAPSSAIELGLTLVLFGAALAAVDVATNVASIALEVRCRRPLLSGLHGLFSVGALLGALLGSVLLAHAVPVRVHFLGVSACVLIAGLLVFWALGSTPSAQASRTEAATSPRLRLNRVLLALAGLAFCASLAEGSVADWSGVYLKTVVQATPGLWSLGFAAFSLTMIVGRLLGDRLTLRLGHTTLGRLGGMLAAVGLALTLSTTWPWTAVGGFAVMGLGLSVLGPLTFSAAGGLFPHQVPAVMAALGAVFQAGYLAGPAMIAALTTVGSLRLALLSVVALLLCAAVLARSLNGSVNQEERRVHENHG